MKISSAPVRISTLAVYPAASADNEQIHALSAFIPRETALGIHRTEDYIGSLTVIYYCGVGGIKRNSRKTKQRLL